MLASKPINHRLFVESFVKNGQLPGDSDVQEYREMRATQWKPVVDLYYKLSQFEPELRLAAEAAPLLMTSCSIVSCPISQDIYNTECFVLGNTNAAQGGVTSVCLKN